jgi:prevent-host-death family protein
MKIASITEAKNTLSALIDGLKGGAPVLIVDRGRPVARLEPVTGGTQETPDGRLARLLRDGIVRPRRAAPSRTLFSSPPTRLRAGASGVDVLIRERQEGR